MLGYIPYWDSVHKGQNLEVRVQMLLDTSGKSLDSEYKCVHVDHSQTLPESGDNPPEHCHYSISCMYVCMYVCMYIHVQHMYMYVMPFSGCMVQYAIYTSPTATTLSAVVGCLPWPDLSTCTYVATYCAIVVVPWPSPAVHTKPDTH